MRDSGGLKLLHEKPSRLSGKFEGAINDLARGSQPVGSIKPREASDETHETAFKGDRSCLPFGHFGKLWESCCSIRTGAVRYTGDGNGASVGTMVATPPAQG